MTFRARLLLTSLTILAIGLGALVVTGNVLLGRRVAAETTSLLRARAEAELAALRVERGRIVALESTAESALDQRAWVLQGGRIVERPRVADPALDRAAIALGRSGQVGERHAPGEVRLRAQPVRDRTGRRVGVVVVGVSVDSLTDLRQRVLLGSVVVAGLVLLAGWLAIRAALDGALRPVAQMTAEAEDWGAHDLDRRFGLGPPRDELTGLAATLDHLLARIAASRRNEQRFAGEVAHELRTPLAALRGRAELALEGADADRRAALESVVEQAARLDAAVDTLLAVARRDLDPSAGAVDLAALARELPDVEVRAPAGLPLAAGDPDVVRRALAPLVDNARRHARSTVALELDAPPGRVRLTVRDDGPGIDPALGERAFEPGARGAGGDGEPGAGLGLPLARRLARSCGGDVVLRPGDGGRVALELPALGG